MRDEHCHCPCNGVWLCGTCHREVHKHPFDARSVGFIVSRHGEPYRAPVMAYYGPVLLDCRGGFDYYGGEF